MHHVRNGLKSMVLAALLPLLPMMAQPRVALAQIDIPARGVPYLTVRDHTGSTDPATYYGDGRGSPKAGFCTIAKPDLQLLEPVVDAVPSYLSEDFLKVDRLIETSRDAVFEAVSESAAGRAPVLYTHGYFIGFEKGCRRATLFEENAQLDGRLLWFSWPSDGALINYTRDESDLYWSVPDLADAILDTARRFPERPIHVAGHSLGARGIVLALYDVASRSPDVRIGEVVLLAPDMDFGVFARMLPRIAPIVGTVTVYVAENDRPLAMSSQLHGYRRLGEAGNDVAALQGIEVIDVSALPESSPTGHLYHVHSPAVGADLEQLLDQGMRAGMRRNLEAVGPNVWRMVPEKSAPPD
jgi:esterase/lipase superfamily enzyme